MPHTEDTETQRGIVHRGRADARRSAQRRREGTEENVELGQAGLSAWGKGLTQRTQRLVVHRGRADARRRAQRRREVTEVCRWSRRRVGKASHRGHRDTEGYSSQSRAIARAEDTEAWRGNGGVSLEASEGRKCLTQRTRRHRVV